MKRSLSRCYAFNLPPGIETQIQSYAELIKYLIGILESSSRDPLVEHHVNPMLVRLPLLEMNFIPPRLMLGCRNDKNV